MKINEELLLIHMCRIFYRKIFVFFFFLQKPSELSKNDFQAYSKLFRYTTLLSSERGEKKNHFLIALNFLQQF